MITRFSYVSLYIFVHAMFCIVFLVPFFLSSGVVFVVRWSQNIAKSYFFGILIILYPFDDILPHLASQHHVMWGTSEWGQGRSGKERQNEGKQEEWKDWSDGEMKEKLTGIVWKFGLVGRSGQTEEESTR